MTIYRDGILKNGSPLMGYVRDMEINSTVFSCENCHMRSGLGSTEGQVLSPPVNSSSLFNPRYLLKDQVKNTISKRKGVERSAPMTRPAYTDTTLATAIRDGLNPLGRELLPIMPRYTIDDSNMTALIDYLKNLSAKFSPGVDDQTIKFATVVTDDVSQEDRQAMLASLETLVTINRQTKTQRKDPRFFKMFRMLDAAFYKDVSIATWELKGDPSSWNDQLAEYYRREPVFALLGGISNRPWQPIHDFCEKMKLPCLFPVTDLPVVSGQNWYTFYSSKGYFQEGETAARFLADKLTSSDKVLQIAADSPEGEALASGFSTAWREKGRGEPVTVRLSASDIGLAELQKYLGQGYASVVVWSGASLIPALKMLDNQTIATTLFLSSRYLGKAASEIPPSLRSSIYLSYPFRLPDEETAFANYSEAFSLGKLKAPDSKRIASRTYSMIHIFLLGLKETKLNYYRDTLLDSISMLPDQYLPDFVRYSFGPGQRYASKGCYVVQQGSSTDTPSILKRSDWVVF